MNSIKKKISIIGGGPAGIYSAMQLLAKGYQVDLFEYKANLGRKFLVAGHGGLNLTHGEELSSFSKKYYENEKLFEKLLAHLSPTDYKNWLASLGVETFTGTSNRVFPRDKTAKEIIQIWKQNLEQNPNFTLHFHAKLIDLDNDGNFSVQTNTGIDHYKDFDHVILALGGASWPKTGSNANWIGLMEKCGVEMIPFTPMNCGYSVKWSSYLTDKDVHISLKNIELKVSNQSIRGEAMVTSYGIEGSGIYALNHYIKKCRLLEIDLKPDLTPEVIVEKLNSRSPKNSLTNHLRKSLGLDSKVFSLLREKLSNEQMSDMNLLAQTIKNFVIELHEPRAIEEAISSSGGISFSELNDDFSLKKIKRTSAIGEMVNWDAPTGGYLLQGCFSMAHYACLKL